MKFADNSVISEPVEFIFNLLNVLVTKLFLVFSYETVKFIPNTPYMLCIIYIKLYIFSLKIDDCL